jgi:hemoglobin
VRQHGRAFAPDFCSPFKLLARISSGNMNTPYDQMGGREPVLRLAHHFYDLMEQREPELTALHERDEHGRVSARSRDRFASFLVGWLGGPDDYVRANGHPRLRMRHGGVAVNIAMRDAWLRCMYSAMEDCGVPNEVQAFLRQRFSDVADFMRNVQET